MIAQLILLTLISLAYADQRPDLGTCETIRLSFQPYSTSYLPKYTSPLTRRRVGRSWAEPPGSELPVSAEALANWGTTTLAAKLDQARAEIQSLPPIAAQLESEMYRPNAGFWEGYCNQWASGAQNPDLVKRVEETDSFICGEMIFTNGEMRELFTAFNDQRRSQYIGERSYRRQHHTSLSLLDLTGADDLDPWELESVLRGRLGKNLGVVFDLDHSVQVWNHPLKGATLCSADLTPSLANPHTDQSPTFSRTYGMFELLPSYIWEGLSQKATDLLRAWREIDREITQTAMRSQTRSRQQIRRALEEDKIAAKQELDKLGIDLSRYSIRWNQEVTDVLYDIQLALRMEYGAGNLKLASGIKIKRVDATIEYMDESWYGEETNYEKQTRYDYLLLENDEGRIFDSVWVTPAAQRPDAIWFPSLKITKRQKELLDLIDKCALVKKADLELLTKFREGAEESVLVDLARARQSGGGLDPQLAELLLRHYGSIATRVFNAAGAP